MKLLIVTSAPLIYKNEKPFAYGPFVKEMEIWQKYVDKIAFCCPEWKNENELLTSEIAFKIDKHFSLIDSNLIGFANFFKAIFYSIYNFVIIFKAMIWADHIHLRCPGNIGLIGCIAQILFPYKIKTAKYAGNWDPESNQPKTYKFQKWILNNTFLTKNIQVLVYGEWANTSKNIKPFFTATYSENEKTEYISKKWNQKFKFIFIGTLVEGKKPLYAIQLIQNLLMQGFDVALEIYGSGTLKQDLKSYISENKLEENAFLKGNQSHDVLKIAYQQSHFVILPSESEGWPKAIAEGMFWGCVPISTKVSCVPYMLDYGKRGIILEMKLSSDIQKIIYLLQNQSVFQQMSFDSFIWSNDFTTNKFEDEIKKILLCE